MNDAASDKKKRTHGAMWYVVWILLVYIASMLPIVTLTEWAVNAGWMPESLGNAIGFFYLPIFMILSALGLENALNTITQTIQRMLP